jgi:hypothetical protein
LLNNAAVAEKRSADVGVARIEYQERLTPKEIRAISDQLGDIARALDWANARELAELYDALRLASITTIQRGSLKSRSRLPRRVDTVRVRGVTRTLTTQVRLNR